MKSYYLRVLGVQLVTEPLKKDSFENTGNLLIGEKGKGEPRSFLKLFCVTCSKKLRTITETNFVMDHTTVPDHCHQNAPLFSVKSYSSFSSLSSVVPSPGKPLLTSLTRSYTPDCSQTIMYLSPHRSIYASDNLHFMGLFCLTTIPLAPRVSSTNCWLKE